MKAWNVVYRGCLLDIVFTVDNMEADECKRGLVEHDGYHPEIVVRQGAKPQRSVAEATVKRLRLRGNVS